MNNKTLAAISYITIIGWLYVYFTAKEKDNLLKYHLRQSFGLFLAGIIAGFAVGITAAIMPTLAALNFVVWGLNLVLMITGAVNAGNGINKPLPVIGKIVENKFAFVG